MLEKISIFRNKSKIFVINIDGKFRSGSRPLTRQFDVQQFDVENLKNFGNQDLEKLRNNWAALTCCLNFSDTRIEVTLKPEEARVIEKRVSDQILQILEHYKQEDPIGLPGAPVPDPMEIPDMKQSFSVATMNFKNTNVYGLSKFRIEHIRSNLADMKVKNFCNQFLQSKIFQGRY